MSASYNTNKKRAQHGSRWSDRERQLRRELMEEAALRRGELQEVVARQADGVKCWGRPCYEMAGVLWHPCASRPNGLWGAA